MKNTVLRWGLLIALIPALATAQEDELLPPEDAFQLQVEAVDAGTVHVQWNIAEGYYLYGSKFRFNTDTPGAELSEAEIPPGKKKQDEFFGEVEIHRGTVDIQLPVTAPGGELELQAGVQGCADIGVCYPPYHKTVSLKLPAAAPAPAPAPAPAADTGPIASIIGGIGDALGLGDSGAEFLDPDEAFQYTLEALDGNTLLARWQIADGYYLYRDRMQFTLEDGQGIQLGEAILPAGKVKVDPNFGRMEVYYHQAEARIPLLRSDGDQGQVVLKTRYQGCADAGLCYPPIDKTMTLSLPGVNDAVAASPPAVAAPGTPAGAAPAAPRSEQDRIAASLASGSTWVTVATFFGFGLLLAFTPCVFPMIPILSSIIVGQGPGMTTRRAFTLSLVYVLAMALTYTVVGVIAGLFGSNLQAAFQSPIILGVFAALFVALALSMFGFYELQLPAALQSKLTEISNRQQGGSLIGVAIMGLLSALIVGPCVAPPLAGALIYIGQSGDAVLGGLALFALSMGMGIPLIAIGTSAGKALPKAGDWMDTVKAVFGVMLLGVAIWMLERIVPAALTMALWGILLITSGIYMGALEPLHHADHASHTPPHPSGWRKLWKGLGVVLLIYGALLMVGAASGSKDPLQPLKGVAIAGATSDAPQSHELAFQRIKTVADLERQLAAASAAGKTVMLDFYADWCVSCKELERYTFSDAGVQRVLANTVLLQADVTANDEDDKALLKRFGLIGPPSILFFGSDGRERKGYRLVGFLDAAEFRDHATRALGKL
jgi:thiol:disulfide interchange protein DsbD